MQLIVGYPVIKCIVEEVNDEYSQISGNTSQAVVQEEIPYFGPVMIKRCHFDFCLGNQKGVPLETEDAHLGHIRLSESACKAC